MDYLKDVFEHMFVIELLFLNLIIILTISSFGADYKSLKMNS